MSHGVDPKPGLGKKLKMIVVDVESAQGEDSDEDEGYEWKMEIEKEEGPAKKKSRRDDLDELREMFGTIMKRLRLATCRISEVEREMKTLKDWKLDLSYKKPEINVFEIKNGTWNANHNHEQRRNH